MPIYRLPLLHGNRTNAQTAWARLLPPPPASPHGDTMDGASLARRGNATDTGKATANASDRDDQPRHAPVYDTTDGAMIAATGRSGGKENRKRQDGEKSGEQSGAGTR